MKILVLTKVEKDIYFSFAWSGEVFFKSNNSKGIIDPLELCRILKLKYLYQANMFVGDFCVINKYVEA